MLIFVICYIISKEEDIPAHFSAEVSPKCSVQTAFDKFVDDATQCILGCTRRASRAALLCRGERNPRDEFVIELKIERIELLPELCLES